MKKLLLLAIVVLGFSAVSFGQAQTELTGNNASATIIKTLELATSGDELNFGTIGSPESASYVDIAPADGSREGTADIVGDDGTVPTFTITGEPDELVTVTIPKVALSLTGAGTPMTVTNWTTDLTTDLDEVDLGGTGIVTFKVGARLNVNAGQTEGVYTGTYAITVGYN